jgi:DNA primase
MSTSPLSSLDKIDYRNRILIPIYWEQEVVSFQARAISNKSKIKYKACPKEREAVPHQEVLYGKLGMGIQPTRTAICVEGVTDVWRLQPFTSASVVGVFGIEFSPKQTRLLSRLFDSVVVIFDDDPQAVLQAKRLVSELRFRGTAAYHVAITGDPGGMSWTEAKNLTKQIGV